MNMDQMYLPQGKSYFASQNDTASGFKYRVEGNETIQRTLDSLRGGIEKDAYGKIVYDEQFRMMNDLGLSRAQFFLVGIVNKNTHLTKFKDEDQILRQTRALAREWCVTVATNRKRWSVKDPDLVQNVMEGAILASLLRATDGFEADLSAKTHHVQETINSPGVSTEGQSPLARLAGMFGGRR
jgi:hypothetical protein